MSTFSATFAAHNKCTLLNSGNAFGLCLCGEGRHGNSNKSFRKNARKRAKRSRTAGICDSARHNALNSGRGACCR
jgi:hypothetical protein